MNIVTEDENKAQKTNTQPRVSKPESAPASGLKRIARRTTKNLNTPSIKDALQGRQNEQSDISAKEQHQLFSANDEAEEFTKEQLEVQWKQFVSRLEDRPNLQSTLSTIPEIKDDFQLYLPIENTIQENLINGIKPELVSFLRKELKNSKIHLITEITEKTTGRIIYTDEERYKELLKKNPSLALLKQKFNLDFN